MFPLWLAVYSRLLHKRPYQRLFCFLFTTPLCVLILANNFYSPLLISSILNWQKISIILSKFALDSWGRSTCLGETSLLDLANSWKGHTIYHVGVCLLIKTGKRKLKWREVFVENTSSQTFSYNALPQEEILESIG